MPVAAPRTVTERKADTLAMLGTPAIDVWVASADIVNGAMRAHLVPLSLAWMDGRVVIAVGSDSATAATSANMARPGSGSVPPVTW